MPVSSGLQKYFDSQRQKKGDIKQRFEELSWQIDPAFMHSFEAFHDRIIDIVDENPEAIDVVSEELDDLGMKLHKSQRKHNLQKAATIINISENLS